MEIDNKKTNKKKEKWKTHDKFSPKNFQSATMPASQLASQYDVQIDVLYIVFVHSKCKQHKWILAGAMLWCTKYEMKTETKQIFTNDNLIADVVQPANAKFYSVTYIFTFCWWCCCCCFCCWIRALLWASDDERTELCVCCPLNLCLYGSVIAWYHILASEKTTIVVYVFIDSIQFLLLLQFAQCFSLSLSLLLSVLPSSHFQLFILISQPTLTIIHTYRYK